MTRVLLAVPTRGTVTCEWSIAFANVLQASPPGTEAVFSSGAMPIDLKRDFIALYAMRHDFSHVLFLDDDVIAPVDVVSRLVAHGLPIVGGLVSGRGPPEYQPAVQRSPNERLRSWTPGELIRNASFCGTACLLVSVEAFKAIPRPWFLWTFKRDIFTNTGEATDAPIGTSEDGWFCETATAAGIEIAIDTSVICLHQRTFYLLPDPEGTRVEPHTYRELPSDPVPDKPSRWEGSR